METSVSVYDLAKSEAQKLLIRQDIDNARELVEADTGFKTFGEGFDFVLLECGRLLRENRLLKNMIKSDTSFGCIPSVKSGTSDNKDSTPTFAPSCPVVDDILVGKKPQINTGSIDLNPLMIKPDDKSDGQSYHHPNAGVLGGTKRSPAKSKKKRAERPVKWF